MRLAILIGAVAVVSSASANPGPMKISLEVQNADIHGLLRLFGDVARMNFVVGEDVQGKVTVRLRNVTVGEALDAVLAARGLGTEQKGSIVRIAPLERLAAEAKQRADVATARRLSGPLVTTMIRVNYATADQLAAMVKSQLSERGTVSVDQRTNTLIVRDVEP